MTLGFASEDLTVGPTVREFCPILKLVFKLNFRPKFFILIVDARFPYLWPQIKFCGWAYKVAHGI